MKYLTLLVFACSLHLAGSDKTNSATYVSASDIQTALSKLPQDAVTDLPLRVVDIGKGNAGVAVVLRSAKPVQTAVDHEQVTEIYYILEGSGTLVTGGTLVKPKRTSSPIAGPTNIGTVLENGESRKVGPGDVVIIPAGVGHWFSHIDGEAMRYMIVRFDPDKVLPEK